MENDCQDLYVGVGASAGGLEALSEFFSHIPADTRMRFVVIQHLSPTQKSHMAELLGRKTTLPVRVAANDQIPMPGTVTVMPSDKHLEIRNGRLRLIRRVAATDFLPQLAIDTFFDSLALDQRERSVGVVLSGTGSDGTRGVRSIKEAGGLVAVQEPASAKFDGMPCSAIATGLADYVEAPAALAGTLHTYAIKALPQPDDWLADEQEAHLGSVLALLERHSGIDFKLYKQSTVLRRMQRRMAVVQVETLAQYEALVSRSPAELDSLRRDLLIHVTSFYRDPEAWDALRARIPEMISRVGPNEALRCWVTACSTGEEAYSLAMLIQEQMEEVGHHVPYKIFATDVDASAVATAGLGVYGTDIAADLPRELLGRWFTRHGDHFRVSRELRDRIVFAQHNLIRDPPFAKMNLITCRNMLIYLLPDVQHKALSVLQFSLKQGGLLMLGHSESVGDSSTFEAVDSRWKIFRSTERSSRLLTDGVIAEPLHAVNRAVGSANIVESPLVAQIQAELIENSLPATAVVDAQRQLVMSYGDLSPYLRIPSGAPTLDLAKLARGELSLVLTTAIRRALKEAGECTFSNVAVDLGEESRRVRLRARRVENVSSVRSLVVLSFEAIDGEARDGEVNLDVAHRNQVSELEQELQFTRESLQATVEELETTNEELQASNEELISSNEELQSTNEELQSVNEELHTMNAEYQIKINELTVSNDDFVNLMKAAQTSVIFLDDDLRIRRFTETSDTVIHLVPADIGRRIDDLKWRIHGTEVTTQAREVLVGGPARHSLVCNRRGEWFRIDILPYEAIASQAKGVVISIAAVSDGIDIELAQSSHFADAAALPMVVVDAEGAIGYANPPFATLLDLELKSIQGALVADVLGDPLATQITACRSDGSSWVGEMVLRTGAEAEATHEISIAPIGSGVTVANGLLVCAIKLDADP